MDVRGYMLDLNLTPNNGRTMLRTRPPTHHQMQIKRTLHCTATVVDSESPQTCVILSCWQRQVALPTYVLSVSSRSVAVREGRLGGGQLEVRRGLRMHGLDDGVVGGCGRCHLYLAALR